VRESPEETAGFEADKEANELRFSRAFRADGFADESDRPIEPARGKQLTIEMDPSGRNNLPVQGLLGGATMRIKPPQPIRLGGDVAIRIKSADGRRELREIHSASRQDGYLEMTIPPGWMPDGYYSVEVLPLGQLPKVAPHRHEAVR
jgi:hypothetical protein